MYDRQRAGGSAPSFSVVVPTRDRPRELSRCLEALAGLRHPSDRYEVIVVDDGSRVPVDEIVRGFGSRMSLRWVTQPNRGPAAARNRGAAEAGGRFLAFTDDDCSPEPDWLARFAEGFAADPQRGLGGRTVNALPDNTFSTASQLLLDYIYGYYNERPNRVPLFASNNMALPREIFLELGGFETSFARAGAEDRELCDRWIHAGHRLAYAPDAIVRHAHDLDLRGFLRQHFNYGHGAVLHHSLRARRQNLRPRIEPPAFYRDMLLFPFARGGGRRLRLTAALALSQIANTAGFVEAWLRLRNVRRGGEGEGDRRQGREATRL